MRHSITNPDRQELVRASRDWPSWTCTPRQLGDLELLLSGAYAPLDRFMTHADVVACTGGKRLSDGAAFPEPVVLDVSEACAADAAATGRLVLRDSEGVALAVLTVLDTWKDSAACIGGRVAGLQLPQHYDAVHLRLTPHEISEHARRLGWQAIAAVPTRGFIHRAEYDAARQAMQQSSAALLLMMLSDPTEDEATRLARVRCHEALLARFPDRSAWPWLVPLPRRADAVADLQLAAVAARNAGCTHLLITEPLDADAREAATAFARALNLEAVHTPVDGTPEARLRAEGEPLPDSYTFPEVAHELAVLYPPRHRRGLTLFFTGLSGSGKSTIANLVRLKLLERSGRPVTFLDGDLVRQHLSSELGFSRQHRDLNIRRIVFVAAEITKHRGIAICAPIAPYESIRREARHTVEAFGSFVLVYVDTPLEVCEGRDRKGLYAKARAGLIAEFTGISDPYEPPSDADLVVRTATESADAAAERIIAHLEEHGHIKA